MAIPSARAFRGMLHVLGTEIDNAIYSAAANLPVPFIKLSGASVKAAFRGLWHIATVWHVPVTYADPLVAAQAAALRAPKNQLPELNPIIEGYIKALRNPISPSIFPHIWIKALSTQQANTWCGQK
ncbi:hypothetical protein B0T24DRAFT_677025 [Lasiosphaeria ovina]|uniref:Uncharacterized protein n=1 Tax=Lasiosphaeria ovina TaxID=92902 RepID=A0AAE0KGK5_9PEZI|nr:hypothetical protein B0T24DRAFT_677025 [Lasiosphaeria ovina]